MNLKNIIFILIISIFMLQIIRMNQDEVPKELNTKPTIMLSSFALFDITNNLAKDIANIEMIIPFGVDTHSFEPTPKAMAKLYDSDLVIYSGAGLEPWCKNLELSKKVIDMSKFVNLKELKTSSGHDLHHHDRGVDPHYWLDIDNMKLATLVIYNNLLKLLPESKEILDINKQKYINILDNLEKTYKKQLSSCKLDTILVNHNAYGYLSKKYGFSVESLSGLSPEAEINAKSIIKMMNFIKEYKVKTIFYENFASDKAIKNISQELGISVDYLQPLGNITKDEAKQNLSYEDIMRQNLVKISLALECK